MKKQNTLILILLFILTHSFSQSDKSILTDQCTTCNDPKDRIENNGDNTFTSDSAQAYYWEICNGSATIVGTNTGQTVTISGTPGSTSSIRLTRFAYGNCYEHCETFTIDPIDCNNCSIDIVVQGNTNNALCTSATATLLGCDNPTSNQIVDVEWSWAMAGTSCGYPYPNACPITTTNLFEATIPIGTIVGTPPPYHFLQFYALVTYQDGTTCYVWNQELLECDLNYEAPNPGSLKNEETINMHPNPQKKGEALFFEGIDFRNINTIKVFDIYGQTQLDLVPKAQYLNLGTLNSGIYIVQFTTTSNTVIKKRLVIK